MCVGIPHGVINIGGVNVGFDFFRYMKKYATHSHSMRLPGVADAVPYGYCA